MICNILFLCLWISSSVGAVSPISAKGTKLYDDDGAQFFVKGVSYLAGNGRLDPLVDTTQCERDAVLMEKAGINTIYVYEVSSEEDHDGCMKAFARRGIYVWLQLGVFPQLGGSGGARASSKQQSQGPSSQQGTQGSQWTLSAYAQWTEVFDTFAGYDNVLAFGIGQETVTDNATSTTIAPSLKAAARDLRAFRTARGYRPIPLSYSAADVASFRLLTAQYLTCGSDASDAAATTVDLLGLNIFDDCSETAWRTLRTQFQGLPIPVVISEAGCKPSDSGEREFSEVSLVLSQEYQEVFSGVNVFEWGMHDSGFGVVKHADSAHMGEPETLAEFNTLSSVFEAAKPSGTPREAYTPSNAAPACPLSDAAKGWFVDAGAALPTIEGLQIGTVTVRTTVTGSASRQTEAPAGTGLGQGQTESASNADGNDALSAGAIAGIVISCVMGVLGLTIGGFVCLRRRGRAAITAPDTEPFGREDSLYQEFQTIDEPPPSYTYPRGKIELPAQTSAAAEMDGAPYSDATSRTPWHMSLQETAGGSPALNELPDRQWRRTTQYELDSGHLNVAGDNPLSRAGAWKVSPMTPGTKYA